ncbi:hypothetical protein FACS1894189_4570 [Planctomycetales bacterium]|nr:hypothetical protein FACS1894189_4570 [Planctomycetales bacterium]
MQPNLTSAETNTDKLYQLNSFLKRLAADVDWESFRPALSVLRKDQPKGGRPPFDVLPSTTTVNGYHLLLDNKFDNDTVEPLLARTGDALFH